MLTGRIPCSGITVLYPPVHAGLTTLIVGTGRPGTQHNASCLLRLNRLLFYACVVGWHQEVLFRSSPVQSSQITPAQPHNTQTQSNPGRHLPQHHPSYRSVTYPGPYLFCPFCPCRTRCPPDIRTRGRDLAWLFALSSCRTIIVLVFFLAVPVLNTSDSPLPKP